MFLRLILEFCLTHFASTLSDGQQLVLRKRVIDFPYATKKESDFHEQPAIMSNDNIKQFKHHSNHAYLPARC